MDDNNPTPHSSGRGVRRRVPVTRLNYGQLGNPVDTQLNQIPTLRQKPTHDGNPTPLDTGRAPNIRKSRSASSMRSVASSSASTRLRNNEIEARKKIQELDEQLQQKQDELDEANANLLSGLSRLSILQKNNSDGALNDEIMSLELRNADLQVSVNMLEQQVKRMEKTAVVKKSIINDEKSLHDDIILEGSDDSGSNPDNNDQVRDWIEQTQQHLNENAAEDNFPHMASQNCGNDTISQLVSALGQAFGNGQQQQIVITKQVDKELPIFTGRPEDWLTFKSEFDRTTTRYRYDDSENIVRLRKFVKGSAKDAINHLLANPVNVNKILSVLEQRFGNPQFVVATLIDKAKQLRPPDINKPETIVQYGTAVDALVTNIVAFGLTDYINNIQLLTELVEKLPPALRRDWYRLISTQQSSAAAPYVKENLESFQQWLAMEVNTAIRSVKPKVQEEKPADRNRRHHGAHAAAEETPALCLACGKGKHGVDKCHTFAKLKVDEKWKIVRDAKLCFRCLLKGHVSSSCSKAGACDINGCQKNHHRLLHSDVKKREECPAAETKQEENVIATAGDGALPMIYVKVTGPAGTKKILAMLDVGASFTAIEEDIAAELGLDGEKKPLSFSVFGNKKQHENDSRVVEMSISSIQRNAQQYQMNNVKTVKKLGIPGSPLDFEQLKRQHPYLSKAKAVSIKDEKPKMVIGYNYYRLYHSRFCVEGSTENTPSAYRSRLGWYVCAGVSSSSCHFACESSETDSDKLLHEEMKTFFAIENAGVRPILPSRSKEDLRALELLEKNTKKVGSRWETCLLWKDDDVTLPHSKTMAVKRLSIMEKKMDRDPAFSQLVQQKFDDYLKKGYLVETTSYQNELEPSQRKWYLPWFFAYHPTKKPRLVYDAAAKSNGKSLNDYLLKGPDLLNSLSAVLIRFRNKKIALTGDIKEMFHQVKLRREDWPSQTILYRGSDRNQPPKEYYMRVLFFGAASSPCSAIYVKNKNAEAFQHQYPEAVAATLSNFYMDDFLGSTDTEEDAIRLRKEIMEIHLAGGFEVVKWNSNSRRVLDSIPMEIRAEQELQVSNKGEVTLDKTLGMWWNPKTDNFHFKINLARVPDAVKNGERRPTKREVTSVTMSLFDPLGFLAPVKVTALIIIQNIWKSGISWDDEITPLLMEQWNSWLAELASVETVTIPRILTKERYDTVNLHTFVDGSEEAFSCSVYLQFSSATNVSQCFMAGKARVAPIKGMTIPRMELEAAVTGARLASTVKKILEPTISINSSTYWSDSKTVLCWLRSQTGRFKIYVQSRVGEIQELTNVEEWRWIPTKENVADDATRAKKPFTFHSNCRWLSGVDFILKPSDSWPVEANLSRNDVNENDLEIRHAAFVAVQDLSSQVSLPYLHRFSCWMRLIRATATVLQAVRRFHNKNGPCHVTSVEMKEAERMWIRQAQLDSFPDEVVAFQTGQPLKRKSALSSLTVSFNEHNLIVLRGRIDGAAHLQQRQREPYILDPKHPYTQLWIQWLHRTGGHHGQERVITEIRRTAWVLDCRNAVRRCWATCSACKLRKLKPNFPRMGQLPICRLGESKQPFYHTGVDLFGPFQVKVNRKVQKRWGIIFTCMSTRAVYLDLVETLESGEVISALSRFASLRGPPCHIWSDNGTNFVGANREIKEALALWKKDDIRRSAAVGGIDWHFNPPAAPHMGGSWERLIGMAKKILSTLLKCQAPRESTLRTVFCQAANIINSRPLTYASADPDDPECITPNHLLKMVTLDGPEIPGVFEENDKFRRAWKYTQFLVDEFWRRWTAEYLPTLLKREKWIQESKPLKPGDVVFLVDDLVPRSSWKKGIVTAVYPGKDGQVRVLDVRVAMGKDKRKGKFTFIILRRPVVKVIPLGLNAFVNGCHWEGENVPASLTTSKDAGQCEDKEGE